MNWMVIIILIDEYVANVYTIFNYKLGIITFVWCALVYIFKNVRVTIVIAIVIHPFARISFIHITECSR